MSQLSTACKPLHSLAPPGTPTSFSAICIPCASYSSHWNTPSCFPPWGFCTCCFLGLEPHQSCSASCYLASPLLPPISCHTSGLATVCGSHPQCVGLWAPVYAHLYIQMCEHIGQRRALHKWSVALYFENFLVSPPSIHFCPCAGMAPYTFMRSHHKAHVPAFLLCAPQT